MFAALAAAQTAFAPAEGGGRPIVRNYDHGDFGGEVQNWDVVQDDGGIVYFANNAGVLEFDGRTWRIIELPSRVEVWSLARDPRGQGRIYVGARGDFGYLGPDAVGQFQFHSLLPPGARRERGFDEIITPVVLSSGIYFHLRNSVCRWNEGQLRCRETEAALSRMFAVGEKAYAHQQGSGLMQIVESSLRPVPGGERFANEEITFLLAWPGGEDRILVGTRAAGLFLEHGRSFRPFGTGIRDPLGKDQLLNGAVLPDGSFALATRLRGALIVDRQGHVVQQIDRASGLQDNHVHAVWPDQQGGLWLALQYGVSRVELSSPFSIFDEGSGLEREWREVIRHQGVLYVRGYKGLFALNPSGGGSLPSPGSTSASASPRFSRIAEIQPPVWSFAAVGDDLLVSSRDAIHAVRRHRSRRIATFESRPMALYWTRSNPSRVYVGLAGGLTSLRLTDGVWHDEGRVEGIDETITSIAESPNGDLWLISQAQRAMRVQFAADDGDGRRRSVVRVQRFDPEALTGRVAVRDFANRPVFLTEDAILEFDPASERFVPVASLAALVEAGRRSFSSIAEDSHGNIWVASRKPGNVDFLWKQPDGSYLPDNSGLRQIPIWSIYPDTQRNLVWFCTPEYLLRYDPSMRTSSHGTFPTLIRKVTAAEDDEVVYGGAGMGTTGPGSAGPGPVLSFHANSLRFEFAAATYDDAGRNEFQSYLEGFDTAWSNWSKDARRAYTNLPQGQYRFRARARDVRGQIGEEAAYAFSILPPWYRTAWAYVGYVGLLCGCVLAVLRFERRRSRLKMERERERIELEKLREMDRLKSRFFADVSHEFRTPITLILGPVGQMLEETTIPEVRDRLQRVRQHAQYLLGLISQLLDLSKLESRKMRLRAAAGDFVHDVNALVTQFAALAESQGIALSVDADPDVGTGAPLYFDRDVLEKILNNLLGNAFKFTRRGGAVRVVLRPGPAVAPGTGDREGACVELVVTDTGTGIPREHLPYVFDRFYQIDGVRTREGFGIGLALVKELVDLHYGTISVESEERRGTSFAIRLPTGRNHLKADEIVGEALPAVAAETHPDSGAGDLERPAPALPGRGAEHESTVLVVEDHDELRGFLREQLQSHYRVIEAKDGTEGLERAVSLSPGLVLSDVMMPGMNGYELCRALKAGATTAHIPVVLLTARAGRDDRLQGLGTGADCYLVKPFDPPELLVHVRNLIAQRQFLRQRFSGSVVLKPSEIAVVPADEAFLERVLAIVESNLEDPDFDVERLSRAIGLSRSQLHRKLRSLTHQPPTILIRSIRLHRSAELLAGQAGSVAEIAYKVGFSSQAYFAKCFREQFGRSPKEYREAAPGSRVPGPAARPSSSSVRRG